MFTNVYKKARVEIHEKTPKRKLIIIPILFLIALSIGYINLSKDNYRDVKKAVWDQLPEQMQATVLPNWENAKVKKVIINGNQQLEVTFPAHKRSILGDLTVYVDPTTYKVITISLRA